MIAEANGRERDQVLVGNGGDEILFGTALAWGGPGRVYLDLPPTFSVYAANARLMNTTIVEVLRKPDFTIDEDAVIDRVSRGDIDYMTITSPNNPTGDVAEYGFVERVLKSTDALVMVDEAYFEFSRRTARPLLDKYQNLVILRTFSKAFCLAGVRVGYLLANEDVISESKKVRQPYSVDSVSQAIARVVYKNRAQFEKNIDAIIEQREKLGMSLANLEGVTSFPSESNYILFKLDEAVDAGVVWQKLYDEGILVRDFSKARYLENCLRVSVGTSDENMRFIEALGSILQDMK